MWMLAVLIILAAGGLFLMVKQNRRDFPESRSDKTMALREEQLQVRKTREPLAEVTTHTEVIRETETVTVPTVREEFVVEKNGVEAARIPLREERVDVRTYSVPLNEVSVHRREWQENKQIEADLKKEVVCVETTGDAEYSEERQP